MVSTSTCMYIIVCLLAIAAYLILVTKVEVEKKTREGLGIFVYDKQNGEVGLSFH